MATPDMRGKSMLILTGMEEQERQPWQVLENCRNLSCKRPNKAGRALTLVIVLYLLF